MKIRGLGKIKRTARQHLPSIFPGTLILLYHRIAEPSTDPWELAVSPAHLAEQLEVLRKLWRPTRLQDFIGANPSDKNMARSVVVTFDDGYRDNFYNAKPVLEKFDVPATIFVTTGRIEKNGEFWWDALEAILLQPGELPASLSLTFGQETKGWELGQNTVYTPDEVRQHKNWRAWETPPTTRHRLYQELYALLNPLSPAEQQAKLAELRAWSGLEETTRFEYGSVNAAELQGLVKDNLVEIGAHTVNHVNLSTLPTSRQSYEIKESKDTLETIIDRPVKSFAYTFGRKVDYNQSTTKLVQELGFNCACSNFSGISGRRRNTYELPRVQMHDWNGAEFERQLWQWYGI
ncbi:MAG: polysaccharide deacetylase family protein [Chloroflexi bacterium]|nr:polysaccharide deacetylase family protein [Chloroflexota bacterium]OJV89282.1 MAG: hypothetical protein BGO39_35415 [Chloroflexi bacterium 54-19]